MKLVVKIKLIDERHEHINLYSIHIDRCEHYEYRRFIEKFSADAIQLKNMQAIRYRIDMAMKGKELEDRHFRYEGAYKDNVHGLPSQLDKGELRLYCLCLKPSVLILGNGGIKRTQTYNEDEYLNACVTVLQRLDRAIQKSLENGKTIIDGKIIKGKTQFTIEIPEKTWEIIK